MERLGFRVLFCLVVAVATAALTDPLVESASNAGWFGAGRYTDGSMIDVVPAIVAALSLGLAFALLRASLAASRGLPDVARLRDILCIGTSHSVAPLIPAIATAELCVLASMESVEQLAVAGHVLGGTIWLGAPVPIALAIHGAASVVCTFVVGRLLDVLARKALDIVRLVASIFTAPRGARGLVVPIPPDRPSFARRHPLASRSGLRAPPLLAA